jgi:hypothetical protein
MIWLILVLVLSSCTFPINTQGYVEEGRGLSLEEAWMQTAQYSYIWEEINYWKSPLEFEADGGGDCEDFAVYMMYLLGPESMMVIAEGRSVYHAYIWYNGKIMEPQNYGEYINEATLNIYEWIPWKEALGLATEGGRKSLDYSTK